uniref:Uncharacterized protein n=1 Tax=Ananas comosus var. bracteatus TaxID=296719 RepID=A0A6V7PAG9_ANACO|nr:unnamed protein product [Ananas comosus var. bracteatus]
MRNLFVPPADDPRVLLMLQLTYLRCGGVVLGTAMHHAVVDARSACHFMETWAALARGSPDPIVPPFLDRTLLRARSPPSVTYDHVEYKPDRAARPPGAASDYAAAILTLSKRQVDGLKARCGPAGASAFRAIVAHVWRRLVPPLPPSYFGNAVIRTSVNARVEEVGVGASLACVARRIRGATSQGDEYARSLIDCLESTDMMKLPRSGVSRSSLRVISWLGMSMYDADLGWGEPTFMGPALMYYSGFVYLMNSPARTTAASPSSSRSSPTPCPPSRRSSSRICTDRLRPPIIPVNCIELNMYVISSSTLHWYPASSTILPLVRSKLAC